ncbi:hypothetical protein EHQ53_03380 [Leptospira langatensis]|uniref:Alpha/beta hydrolase n=1 Tax=Leptospira langatensis TaxID=2484983 RepID=A0A5F1ZYD0_9LEPT|nr:hypothetical protein [Leptospira langatensis]TGK04204.1 hypothetical protein EHO57_03610 [Leptospira langatensis]TGL43684.1 hypothetical protein EHQ53_03380 [Leptospira langatensis]
MQDNRWTFTSRGNPKRDEVLWLRDPLHSFNRSFSPELSSEYYLTVAESPEKFSGFAPTEIYQFLSTRKKKLILIAEGFSARIALPFAFENPDKVSSIFLIFPNPMPVSGYAIPLLEKADWFLRNLTQIPRFFLDPFGLEKVWNGLEKEDLYSGTVPCPMGILLPRTVGPLESQASFLQNLSISTSVYRWETLNSNFSEPSSQILAKMLESFLKSGGQKPVKNGTRTRF